MMLVLSRKKNERVRMFAGEGAPLLIGGQVIRVTVVAIEGNRVRLGFDAPDDIKIVRDELCDSPDSERKDSAA